MWCLEECCEICGSIGVPDALVTCSQCKASLQHMYCMRARFLEYPDDWLCEDCEQSSKPTFSQLANCAEVRKGAAQPPKIRKLPNESKRGAFNGEKKIATRKTKYISINDVIKLSSGAIDFSSRSMVTFQSSTSQPPISEEKSRFSRKKSAFDVRWTSSAARTGSTTPRVKTTQEVQKPIKSPQPSQAPAKKHIQKEQSSEPMLPQRKVKSMVKKDATPSSPGLPRVTTISGGRGSSAVEKSNNCFEIVCSNLLHNSENCSTAPAMDALWKGRFNICEYLEDGGLNDIIQAHPPSQVRRKIHDFSKIMPEALQFELVPCKKIWINLFREYHPDSRDIGLYFFPRDGGRAVNYTSLLESLSLKELALRKQIDDVELVVFTSALLPMNCQYWKGKYFLWGVFHHLKRDTTVRRVVDMNEGDCSEEVDMEINMIGGVNVGRLDVAVQKDHPGKDCKSCKNHHSTASPLPGFGSKIDSDSRLLSSVARVLSSDVKIGPPDDIPPGFEEEYYGRVRDTTIDNNACIGVGRNS
ncbi:PHD finger-containing protein 6 isoform X2 [Primulina huaijiensis]|uniref:PHD finger-containing protein 6 isoform X2 n=1 Tax=Primulina huaijiensis TaxID=1492673 RepID=UPI003CC77058